MEVLIIVIGSLGLAIYYINAFRVLNSYTWVKVLLLQFLVVHFLVNSLIYFVLKEKRKQGNPQHRKWANYGFILFLVSIIFAIGYILFERRLDL